MGTQELAITAMLNGLFPMVILLDCYILVR